MNIRDRIEKVIEFYYNRGVNKESVNNLYRKIIKLLNHGTN